MEKLIRTNLQVLSRRLIASASPKRTRKHKLRHFFVRSRKRLIRYSLLTVNLALLGVVVYFVTKTPANSQPAQQSLIINASNSETITGPLDQVSSAEIAVHLARTAGLAESDAVVNRADSITATEATASADINVVSKPQVISDAIATKADIHDYTVAAGDTIGSIAVKFGVSSDSIRWSNGVSGNAVAVGKVLTLPPSGINGIVYIVRAGDTPASLAQKFGANKDVITKFNDAEITGLIVGEKILIPDGTVRAVVVTYSYFSAIYGNNGYVYGWCTWWAAKRRADVGHPLPSNLGNARQWRPNAQSAGMAVNSSPSAGSVAYYGFISGLGHVGFVERVNDDGSIWISDMNYYGVSQIGGSTPAGGWNRVSYHQVHPSEFGKYSFIH